MPIPLSRLAVLALALTALAPPLAGCSSDDGQTGDEQDLTAAKATFEVFQSEIDSQWYFHLLAGNGEVLLASEGYAKESSARSGIETVRKNGVDADRFAVELAADGQAYLVLKAGNGQVVGISETYASTSGAERARDRIVALLERGAVIKHADLQEQGFQLFKCGETRKQHCFRLRAGNGEIVLQSQPYKTEAAAEKGVASVQKNGVVEAQYEVVKSEDGGSAWFRLHAASAVPVADQEIIGRSQVYASASNARAGIEAVIGLLGGEGGKECLFENADGMFSIFDELEGLDYTELLHVDAETELDGTTYDQIWAAVNVHFPSDFDDDEQDVFSFFDDSSLIVRDISDPATGRKFNALEFTSGDTPLATIFEAGSTEAVVLVAGDQDIDTCTVK
jgi:uncharacterized protein YegP (UPF0339 family)